MIQNEKLMKYESEHTKSTPNSLELGKHLVSRAELNWRLGNCSRLEHYFVSACIQHCNRYKGSNKWYISMLSLFHGVYMVSAKHRHVVYVRKSSYLVFNTI